MRRPALPSRRCATAASCRCLASGACCWPSTRWTWSIARKRRLRRDPRRVQEIRRASFRSIMSRRSRSLPATATISCDASTRMAWYTGPTVLQHLETVPVSHASARAAGALPCAVGGAHRQRRAAAMPAMFRPAPSTRATASSSRARAAPSTISRIYVYPSERSKASKPDRPQPSNLPIRSMSDAATSSLPPMRGPKSPTSSPPIWCG